MPEIRRAVLRLAIVAGFCGLHACASQVPPRKPWNLVLITLDTTRASAVGAYGQALPITPNLDRLAADGVLFEHAVASNPSTLASHTTIFTGLHPFAHGVRSNQGYRVPRDLVTLAERLAQHGYRTGAEISAAVLRRETRIAQGFDHVRDTGTPGVEYESVAPLPDGQPSTRPVRTGSDVTDGGIGFIREHRDRPFFLWLHYFGPHNPYEAPEKFRTRFPDNPYLAEVAALDAEVGRVVAEIDDAGLRDRTLVVVTADHGEGLGEHGEKTHVFFVYESTMRVPLIFWGPPSLPRGRRVTSVVGAVDLLPTLLDWLELPSAEGLHGESLRSIVEGEDSSRVAYGEAIDLYRVLGTTPLRLLREGRWKYIHKVNPELYDLEADPAELSNLASHQPEKLERLRELLEALLSRHTSRAGDAGITLDSQTQRELIALGYIAPASAALLPDEVALLEAIGEDPATLAADLEVMSRAKGRLLSKRWRAAFRPLEGLVERHPSSGHLRALAGEALAGMGRYRAATVQFDAALALEPDSSDIVSEFARALVAGGDPERAERELSNFLERHPCSNLRSELNRILGRQRRYREQIERLAEGERVCPDSESNLNNYAWALATSPEIALRDGLLAVAIARRAIELSDGQASPNLLDTLAAAHAQAGDIAAAVGAQTAAVEILEQEGANPKLIERFRDKLAEFEARRPADP